MIIIWFGVGLALLAVVIRWLLTGIVPESWFAAFGRWCDIYLKIFVATALCGVAAFVVYALALS